MEEGEGGGGRRETTLVVCVTCTHWVTVNHNNFVVLKGILLYSQNRGNLSEETQNGAQALASALYLISRIRCKHLRGLGDLLQHSHVQLPWVMHNIIKLFSLNISKHVLYSN